jgi:hypothetical protein
MAVTEKVDVKVAVFIAPTFATVILTETAGCV